MTLSPTERRELLALAARNLTEELLEAVPLDELATLELSTAGQLLGLGPAAAAKVLPVIEVGPRTRRVTVADYKAFLASRRRDPKAPSSLSA